MKKRIMMKIVLIVLIVIIIITGCSLFGVHTGRAIGYKSICWEGNDHIIVYCSISQYRDVMDMGGGDIAYNWKGGEIWRINVNTGEKEQLFSKKEGIYWIPPRETRIDVVSGHIYISGSRNTYKVKEDYSEWEIEIDSVICPVVSEDERYIVGTRVGGDVVKYDRTNKTIEVICEEPGGIISDYDYFRNYLLVNNNKFIDLNTGVESIVAEPRDTINNRFVISYSFAIGKIENDNITMDATVWDLNQDYKDIEGKIVIEIENFEQKIFKEGIQGVLSPDGSKYISASYDSIWIIDTMGNSLNKITFDGDKI